jgi:hypothetical protein
MSDEMDLAGSLHKGAPLSKKQAKMLSFFIFAMVPCIVVLASPANLDIVYAESARNESINVTIVNRGGQAAEQVELWGDGEKLATIGRMEGFGVWEGVHVKGHPARLVVMAGGKAMDTGPVFYPSGCDIIFLALAITAAGKAIPAFVKKR